MEGERGKGRVTQVQRDAGGRYVGVALGEAEGRTLKGWQGRGGR